MTQQEKNNEDKWWLAALLVLLLLYVANAFFNPLRAQKVVDVKDTIPCNTHGIKKVLEKQTPKSIKYYAVYNDGEIQEIIYMSKTTKEYIDMCRENGIRPSLGIQLKNGQILSIVRYKRRYGNKGIQE